MSVSIFRNKDSATGEAKTLLSTINGGATQKLSGISLPPYTVYIGEVTK